MLWEELSGLATLMAQKSTREGGIVPVAGCLYHWPSVVILYKLATSKMLMESSLIWLLLEYSSDVVEK